jgi:UDP-N-acetylmuramoyl-tripeptide--D-alanyl-D-alanine ligase
MAETAVWKQPLHQARRILAKLWLKLNPQVKIIGLTGSYGKTNTARAITQVLSERYRTLQTDLNLDTVYNLPMTLLKLRPWHQVLVLEYGVDHQNEMDFHLSLVKPSIAVITGINPTHSDPELLGSLAGVIKEKTKLLQALPKDGLAVLNQDDENVRKMAKKTKAKVIRYGTSRQADFWAEEIKVDFSGTSFKLGSPKSSSLRQIKTGLIGRHFVHQCLAAAAVGRNLGLSWPEIEKGLAKLKPLKGRVSVEKGPLGSILINDALRANPASTMAGLQVLTDLPTQGRRIAVLGEMGELGVLAEKSHREVGQAVAKAKIDYLISVGPLQKLVAEEAKKGGMRPERVLWVKDVHQAAKVLEKILKKGDLVYLKGSLLRHLERVLLLLNQQKVGCRKTVCHHYQPCSTCPELQRGL